ncbi:WD40 repeat domain-containing protein [Streptomyces sp. NPDC054770]
MSPAGGRRGHGLGGLPAPSEEIGHGEKSCSYVHASDQATVNQAQRDMFIAERDLHLHFLNGVRGARQVVAASVSDECPYPGLTAFGIDQSQWFFGRDDVLAGLLVRLDRCRAVGGALVVVAPSGAGKSSLLRAGLLAALERGALPGSTRWPLVWLNPTSHPMEALGNHLWEVMGSGSDGSPVLPPDTLRRALARGPGERRLVLVVDQLEELFTLCPDKQEQRAFLDTVLGIAELGPGGEPPPALVVFGLRSDFYTQCAAHPGLLKAVERNQLMVGPLTRTGVQEAILFPAQMVGLDVEPGLVQILLRDLGGPEGGPDDAAYEIGRLPLLAHALRATWMRRAGHVLTVDGYEATGGIANSVAAEADSWFDRLDPPAQQTAQSVFLRLITFGGSGTRDTRRPVPYDELVSHCARPEEAAQVIEKFTKGRLLTKEEDKVTITHEVLLRTWPRLQQWIREHRVRYLARQRLEDAAAAWEEAGRDPGMLYRGGRLEEARALARGEDEGQGRLGPVASGFLAASVRHRQRARRMWQGLIACLSVLAVLVAVMGVVALMQSAKARQEGNIAFVGELRGKADHLRTTDASLAAQLDLVADRMKPAESTQVNMLGDQNKPLATVLTGHEGQVNTVDFSPDGRELASADSKGVIRLWDTAGTGTPTALGEPLHGFHKPLWGVVFSPDGHFLAAAGEDGTIRRWDIRDPRHPTGLGDPITVGGSALYTLAISPDGHSLAAAGDDGLIHLWDVTDLRHPKPLAKPLIGAGSGKSVYGVAFSPDGRLLASGGSDGTVRLWNVTDPRRPSVVGKTDPVAGTSFQMVAFRHDNRTLAAAGNDGTTHLWDVSNPAEPARIDSPNANAAVNAVAFSRNGDLMAYGGYDNAVWLDNMASPKDYQPLTPNLMGHTGSVWGLAFDPEGTRLASAGDDHTVRVWTMPHTILTGHADSILATALSRNGHLLASGSSDGTVRLWDVSNTADPRLVSKSIRVDTKSQSPYAVAFHPRGKVLAVSTGPKVQLWDLTDPARPRLLGSPPGHADDSFLGVAFTRDGNTLAGGNSDGTVVLWNVADPSRPKPLGQPLDTGANNQINRVAVSPDGRTLAAASNNGKLRLWDIADPAHPKSPSPLLSPSEVGLNSVVFSPNSRIVAAAGDDARLRLWDVGDPAHPRQLGQELTGHTGRILALAFSPDGRTMVSGGTDQTLRLWDVHDPGHARPYGEPMADFPNYIDAITFSPHGRDLFIGDGAYTVRVLHMTTRAASDYICRSTGNVLTREIWREYVTHDGYNPPCGHT